MKEKRVFFVCRDIYTHEVIKRSDGWKDRKDVENFLNEMPGITRNIIDDYWKIGDRKVYIGCEWRRLDEIND